MNKTEDKIYIYKEEENQNSDNSNFPLKIIKKSSKINNNSKISSFKSISKKEFIENYKDSNLNKIIFVKKANNILSDSSEEDETINENINSNVNSKEFENQLNKKICKE